MFKITSTQMEFFTSRRLNVFAKELAERARERYPDECAELLDEVLIELLKTETETARSFGFRKRGELKRYADLSLTLGFGFAKKLKWVRVVFETEELTPQARLRDVEESAVFVVRGD